MFTAIVKARLAELDAKAFTVEQSAPLPDGSVRNVLRGRDPSVSRAMEICAALGLEFYIGPPRPDPTGRIVDAAALDLEMIRRFDVVASAGDGREVKDELEREPLAFRRDWLIRQGIRPADAVLIEAQGSSMEPVIHDGDLVMVDTSRTEVPILRKGRRARRAMYWVVRDGGDLRVKDVERTDEKTFVLTSENTFAHRPEVITLDAATDFEVIGRVVWWGHTVPI